MFLNNDIEFGTSGAFCESLNNENNRDGSFVKKVLYQSTWVGLVIPYLFYVGVKQVLRFDWYSRVNAIYSKQSTLLSNSSHSRITSH